MKVQRPKIGEIPCRECKFPIEYFEMKSYLRAIRRPVKALCRQCSGGVRHEQLEPPKNDAPVLKNFWRLIEQAVSGSSQCR